MWKEIEKHLEESRIYKRPKTSFIECKYYNNNFYSQLRAYYPLIIEASFDYSRTKPVNITKSQIFAPKSPIHFEVSSNGEAAVNFRWDLPEEYKHKPSFLFKSVFSTSVMRSEDNSISWILKFETNDKFNFSTSFNPLSFYVSYFRNNFGTEFVYNVAEEQPSMSFIYHRHFEDIAVTVLSSLYGNVSGIVTTDLGFARFSSYLDTNLFTLSSKLSLGVSFPFRNHFANISFKIPTKTLTFELSLNKFVDDDRKKGISFYFPIKFRK